MSTNAAPNKVEAEAKLALVKQHWLEISQWLFGFLSYIATWDTDISIIPENLIEDFAALESELMVALLQEPMEELLSEEEKVAEQISKIDQIEVNIVSYVKYLMDSHRQVLTHDFCINLQWAPHEMTEVQFDNITQLQERIDSLEREEKNTILQWLKEYIADIDEEAQNIRVRLELYVTVDQEQKKLEESIFEIVMMCNFHLAGEEYELDDKQEVVTLPEVSQFISVATDVDAWCGSYLISNDTRLEEWFEERVMDEDISDEKFWSENFEDCLVRHYKWYLDESDPATRWELLLKFNTNEQWRSVLWGLRSEREPWKMTKILRNNMQKKFTLMLQDRVSPFQTDQISYSPSNDADNDIVEVIENFCQLTDNEYFDSQKAVHLRVEWEIDAHWEVTIEIILKQDKKESLWYPLELDHEQLYRLMKVLCDTDSMISESFSRD